MTEIIHRTGRTKTRFQEIPAYEEGLYRLAENTYAWLVPNGSWGESNAGLVVGDGESLLIDTLWDVPLTREMLDAMATVTQNAPITTLVNTHADGDHFFGNELLADRTIITSQASYDEMLTTKPQSMVLLGRIGKLMGLIPFAGAPDVGHWFQNMVKPYAFSEVNHTPANETFKGTKTLSIGGREVQLIEVGSAHTMGDLMVYVPDVKTIYTADILFIGSTPVMWAGPIENWLLALDKIISLDVEIVVPGHGFVTGKDGVEQVRDYWSYIVPRLRDLHSEGVDAVEAAQRVVLSNDYAAQPFSTWNSPERIMTNTHTLYRQWDRRTDHPKVPELLGILRHQAQLAHRLPDAQPQAMRRR